MAPSRLPVGAGSGKGTSYPQPVGVGVGGVLPVMWYPLSVSGILSLDAFWLPRSSYHSLDIDLLRFTPEPQTLRLLPPNQ